MYDGGYTAPSLGELGIIVGNRSHGFTVRTIEMKLGKLGFVHTVCRYGRTMKFIVHAVGRNGG